MDGYNYSICLMSLTSNKKKFKHLTILIRKLFYSLLLWIFKVLKDDKNSRIFRNKLYNIYYKELNSRGHKGILFSLFRGFEKLQIPYTLNRLDARTNFVLVIWFNEDDLKIVEKLKTERKIKKLITNPECIEYTNPIRYDLANMEFIDRVLVASSWVREVYKKRGNVVNEDKLVVWPAGVELPIEKPEITITNSCIVYLKRTTDDKSKIDDLVDFVEKCGIKCYIVEYGKYCLDNWLDLIKKVDFVVFYQDCRETQGLAFAESWAQNKPTFVKNSKNGNGMTTITAPYLSNETGLSWETTEDVKSIILKYKEDPLGFLSQFSPYDYVKNNMSDEVTVKNLLDIFNSIEVNNE